MIESSSVTLPKYKTELDKLSRLLKGCPLAPMASIVLEQPGDAACVYTVAARVLEMQNSLEVSQSLHGCNVSYPRSHLITLHGYFWCRSFTTPRYPGLPL